MLRDLKDTMVLGLFSAIYNLAVVLLKLRKQRCADADIA